MPRKHRNNAILHPPRGKYLAPKEDVRKIFARRLQSAMTESGLNQSELARRATAKLPDDAKPIGRDLISNYIAAKHAPSPTTLLALCKALDKEIDELMPPGSTASTQSDDSPSIQLKELEGDKMWLRINTVLPWDKALEVVKIIKETK